MLPGELLRLRLASQQLARPARAAPAALIAWFGAVQAQDFAGAKWAVGQRLLDTTDESVEQAFAAGSILRTHVLRPTWHFVAPADIRWLLALTGPRVKAAVAFRNRTLGLDDALVVRSNAAIARALEGGNHLTRAELGTVLRRAGIVVQDGQALYHLLLRAELGAVICSGPRRGKEFTYALLDERVPPTGPLDPEAALTELITRYFTSHGPATVRDFVWWSELTVADARRGLALSGTRLTSESVEGRTYWFAPSAPAPVPEAADVAYLLPNYDEYTVAYKERDFFYDPGRGWTPDRRDDAPLGHVIVLGGRVAGMWQWTLGKAAVAVEAHWFDEPSEPQRQALAAAAQRYGAFLGVPVKLVG